MKHVDGYNRHHVFWTRDSYRTSTERAFRNHAGLIVLMDESVHSDLHAELEPPLKPTKNQMLGALALLGQLDYRDNQLGTLDVLAWHFREQDSNQARSIGKHLHQQLDKYLVEGAYEHGNEH